MSASLARRRSMISANAASSSGPMQQPRAPRVPLAEAVSVAPGGEVEADVLAHHAAGQAVEQLRVDAQGVPVGVGVDDQNDGETGVRQRCQVRRHVRFERRRRRVGREQADLAGQRRLGRLQQDDLRFGRRPRAGGEGGDQRVVTIAQHAPLAAAYVRQASLDRLARAAQGVAPPSEARHRPPLPAYGFDARGGLTASSSQTTCDSRPRARRSARLNTRGHDSRAPGIRSSGISARCARRASKRPRKP